MAATIAECMLQNIAQPQRNPTAGEKASRRNAYTPPALGNADDSSAQSRAPHNVSAPATSQTAKIPGIDGTCAAISEGCTKIEAPMMMPTTNAVARSGPISRRSDMGAANVGRASCRERVESSVVAVWLNKKGHRVEDE